MKTEYGDIYEHAAGLFQQQIMHDDVIFNQMQEDKSGFPMLELTSYSYRHQRFFEVRIEHFVRELLINGILAAIFERKGAGIYWPSLPQDDARSRQLLTNREYESFAGYEFIADHDDGTPGATIYRYTDLPDKDATELLSGDFTDEIVVVNWSNEPLLYHASATCVELGKGKKLRVCSPRDLFNERLIIDEYEYFITFLIGMIVDYQDFIGAKSVKTLSPSMLGGFRFDVESSVESRIQEIRTFREKEPWVRSIIGDSPNLPNYGYHIIEDDLKSEYPHLEEETNSLLFDAGLLDRFEKGRLIKYLLGRADFARSFITSEYLLTQYDCNDCFDYTAIISGYLKSIEQLLYRIALFSANEGRMIKYGRGRDRNNKWVKPVPEKDTWSNNDVRRVAFIDDNLPCIDTTMGSLWHYFANNMDLLLLDTEDQKKTLIQCLDCYTRECRNNSFHHDNMSSWARVQFVRQNTIFLYIALLAGCKMSGNSARDAEIMKAVMDDRFERLYNLIATGKDDSFVFVYCQDGRDERLRVRHVFREEFYPRFDEYGFLKHALLTFECIDEPERRVIVLPRCIPDEIWVLPIDGDFDDPIKIL